MGQAQVVLDHGQMQGIGRVTALAVRDFDVAADPVGMDVQLDILR